MNFGYLADEPSSFAVMDAAFDAGIVFFDTADVYGGGRSEQLIGRALKSRGGQRPLVATKLGRRSNPHSAESCAFRGEDEAQHLGAVVGTGAPA